MHSVETIASVPLMINDNGDNNDANYNNDADNNIDGNNNINDKK